MERNLSLEEKELIVPADINMIIPEGQEAVGKEDIGLAGPGVFIESRIQMERFIGAEG